ncbi:JNK-interacting protein 1 [Sarcoptes scabiei]|uniref:JNK-interacting protein 1 n=1 Tax=Sarcoptes scabiei TaxID=52283 RepID=A0A834VEN6_SARSC|nr:JNK-interacting protein 1 [Sarcoptes scabiei]
MFSNQSNRFRNHLNHLDQQRDRSIPFMQLNLDRIPKDLTARISLRQQLCHKDLLISKDGLNPSSKSSSFVHSQTIQASNNRADRRRLSLMKANIKEKQNLWQTAKFWPQKYSSPLEKRKTIVDPIDLMETDLILEINRNDRNGKIFSIHMKNDADVAEDKYDYDDNDRCDEKIFDNQEIVITTNKISEQNSRSFSQQSSSNLNHRSYLDSINFVKDNLLGETSMLSCAEKSSQSTLQNCYKFSDDSGISSTNTISPLISSSSSSTSVLRFDKNLEMYSIDQNNLESSSKKPTHRALYKFCSRHSEELDLEVGDLIQVLKEFDDSWTEGINLRTNQRGIFPSSMIINIDQQLDVSELIDESNDFVAPEYFQLIFLGSIEIDRYKGKEVLDESIQKITLRVRDRCDYQAKSIHCLLKISETGIRIYNRIRLEDNERNDSIEINPNNEQLRNELSRMKPVYCFALVQITFCGYQIQNDRHYFAFITRHPFDQQRFACHVFENIEIDQLRTSTVNSQERLRKLYASNEARKACEAVGRAFHCFYNRFVQISTNK